MYNAARIAETTHLVDKVCGEGRQVLWAHRRGGRPRAGAAASRMLGRGRRAPGGQGRPPLPYFPLAPPPPRPAFFCKSKPPSAVTSVPIHLFPLICSLAAKCSGDSLISVLMLQFCSHRPPLHPCRWRGSPPPRLPSVSMARGKRALRAPESAAGLRSEERRCRCFPHPGYPAAPQQLSASLSGALIPALLLLVLRQMLRVGGGILPCFPSCPLSRKLAQQPHLWRGNHLGD